MFALVIAIHTLLIDFYSLIDIAPTSGINFLFFQVLIHLKKVFYFLLTVRIDIAYVILLVPNRVASREHR